VVVIGSAKNVKDNLSTIVSSLIVLFLPVLVFAFFCFFGLPSILTPYDIGRFSGARVYHDFAVSTAEKLDNDCYILTHVPSIYLVLGKNSLQTWFGQNKTVMGEIFNKTDCVMFDEGFWCTLEPYKSSVCKYMHDDYNLTVYAKTSAEGHEFTFYNVSKK
jgi:hypothetical protein